MKINCRRVVCNLIVLILSGSCSSAQVVKNGNFEENEILPWKFSNPSNFGAAEAGYIFSIETETSGNHRNVARLKSGRNSKWAQLKQVLSYKAARPLQKLRLHADIKLIAVYSGMAGVSVRAFGGASNQGLFETNFTGDTGWISVYKDFIVSPSTDSLAVFCSITGTGEVMFDNIRIETISYASIVQSPEAKVYLDSALALISTHAMYRDSVDYPELVKDAMILAADAKSTADCYPAIKFVLSGLKDHHSFFQTPAEASFLNRDKDSAMTLPSGERLGSTVGYLKIPFCMAVNPAMEKVFADSLREAIRKIDNQQIFGWVVDVRDNTGGNCWPMLLGLGPILGEGVFDKKYKEGKLIDSVGYWAGTIKGKDALIIKTTTPYELYRPNPKVALLMNGMTASSGETVVLSFKSRPNTKIFGEPTYGLTTANQDFSLSDGAMLFICKAKQTDRMGNEYGGKIYPDVYVKDDKNTAGDEIIETAVSWLKNRE